MKNQGEFENVRLSEVERQKLDDRLGPEADTLIEDLSAYLASTGRRYKSHYATVLCWARRKGITGTVEAGPRKKTKAELVAQAEAIVKDRIRAKGYGEPIPSVAEILARLDEYGQPRRIH